MKTVVRNFITTLKRYTMSSVINIAGLSLTFAALYIIMVQTNYELTYNRCFTDYERIYRVEFPNPSKLGEYFPNVSRPIGEPLIKQIPFIECGAGTKTIKMKATKAGQNNENYFDANVLLTTPSFFDVVSLEAVAGDLKHMNGPKVMVASESSAKKMGLSVGDVVRCQVATGTSNQKADENIEYTIVAIYKDFAQNSDMKNFEFIIHVGETSMDVVFSFEYTYFAKIRQNADISQFGELSHQLCADVIKQNGGEELADKLLAANLRLTPISETYFAGDVMTNEGNKSTTYTLIGIALLVLVITLINFFNFFFALIPIRIKTVNICKIFGTPRFLLQLSVIFEAIGLVAIALVISYLLIYLFSVSSLATYVATSLNIAKNLNTALLTLAVAFVVAVGSSLYPAHYITSFPAMLSIKGRFAASKSGQMLRNLLIGIQFTISIALIIGSIFLKLQHNYLKQHETGINKEQMLMLRINNSNIASPSFQQTLENEVLKNPQIKEVTWASSDFSLAASASIQMRMINGETVKSYGMEVSPNFTDFMGIKMLDGRGFIPSDSTGQRDVLIYNAAAQKQYNFEVGNYGDGLTVIGICDNFNYASLNQIINPLSISIGNSLRYMFIRLHPNANIDEAIAYVKNCAVTVAHSQYDDEFTVRPFDEVQAEQYANERRLTQLITIFSALSICIALMGVFGLVMIETQHRRHEIGIRRVLGSSIGEILFMLNKKFIYIVAVCFVAASPIAYYFVNTWLGGYAYHINLHWWVFALTLLGVLAIVASTVTIRSYRTATDNPSKSIKAE